MVFTVSDGLLISSIIYRIRKDGRAIKIRIIAGRIVITLQDIKLTHNNPLNSYTLTMIRKQFHSPLQQKE